MIMGNDDLDDKFGEEDHVITIKRRGSGVTISDSRNISNNMFAEIGDNDRIESLKYIGKHIILCLLTDEDKDNFVNIYIENLL